MSKCNKTGLSKRGLSRKHTMLRRLRTLSKKKRLKRRERKPTKESQS